QVPAMPAHNNTDSDHRGAVRVRKDAFELLRGEAVEQPVAAGGNQVGLAAGARLVRRIPGALEFGIGATAPVDVTDRGGTESFARPVVASQVEVTGPGAAIHLRAGEHVVPVRIHAKTGDHLAALGQRGLRAELVV